MNMSKEIIKIAVLFGIATGVAALIPQLIFYACLTIFLFSAIAAVLFYRKREKFELLDSKTAALNGGILGFISFISFTAVFIPCVLVINLIFKNYYNYGLPYFLNLQALWLFVLILITTGLICAVSNGAMLMLLQFIDTLRKGK